MPELPEVETIAADLNELVCGLTITDINLSFTKIVSGNFHDFCELLKGAKILQVKRFAKFVHFILSKNNQKIALLAHLKMTGQFHLSDWPQKNNWGNHDRAAFKLSGVTGQNKALIYRDIRKFGRLWAFDELGFENFIKHLDLGPDALKVSPDEFYQIISAKKSKIKSTLLNQKVIAGLGNIYADEILFASFISPLSCACALTRQEAFTLHENVIAILKSSIASRGSTTSNYQGLKGGGSFQHQHKVYGRTNKPCLRCQTSIQRVIVGGRSTHYCPLCQIVPIT
ncbi:MAG: bifunctional DNA-formamidopyrimidine glycosylase/DNA-(apurinic or apyrimidinic site) lyase [Candidatus Adiutrix sp.]